MSGDAIDRVLPTRRPPGRPIMSQTWSELMFLHWRVPAALLRPLVPAGLEIDTHDGEAWVGLVPFTVSGSRLRPLPPLPLIGAFHEINVRTYVHRQARDPGVWFFSLDAARRLIVAGARALYHLPYRFARFGLTVEESAERRVRFTSRRPGQADVGVALRYGPTAAAQPAAPGTLEHFLAERYILYAARGRALYQARVHHTAYPLQAGAVEVEGETLLAANGIARPDVPPLAHYAAGVDVDIWPLAKLG